MMQCCPLVGRTSHKRARIAGVSLSPPLYIIAGAKNSPGKKSALRPGKTYFVANKAIKGREIRLNHHQKLVSLWGQMPSFWLGNVRE